MPDESDAFNLHFATLSGSTCGDCHVFPADLESTVPRRDSPANPIAAKRVVTDCVGNEQVVPCSSAILFV